MSVDTRTPRSPGGRSPGFDDEAALSTVKVPSDPAQVIVNHASFRVQLGSSAAGRGGAKAPAVAAPRAAEVPRRRARATVVWSGRTEPGDPAAGRLLQAVRNSGAGLGEGGGGDAGATQTLPRVRVDEAGPPTVIGQRGPRPAEDGELLYGVRPARGAYDEPSYGEDGPYSSPEEPGRTAGDDADSDEYGPDGERRGRRQGPDAVHAYYPGRRMNLGVVLLPLRVFLGFISVYAGMGKLCDPVYFDGGERGSMVTWLRSMHPWQVASPLHEFALSHPVGAGLTVAFLQVVVGVLTVFGLWQRVAAAFGALLSAALLLTVSWRNGPVYDAPDIIYLAAWSPLVIAGAPVYSMDSRLAGEAWRRLGPRSDIWDLRRRVLRRGAVMATVVVGLTLLIGSMLGGAVRSTDLTTVPGPTDAPRNHQQGSPLPKRPGSERTSQGPTSAGPGSPEASRSASPSAPSSATAPGAAAGSTATAGAGEPTQGVTGGQAPPQQTAAPEAPPSRTAGPSSTGGAGSPPSSGGSTSGGSSGGSSSGGSSSGGALGGLLG